MVKNKKFDISSIKLLSDAVEAIRPIIKENSIFLLTGDLGVGKTEFVKQVIKNIHLKDTGASPTFSLQNIYLGTPIIEHWDLYRLKNQEELDSAGFWDQFADRKKVIFVEWSNNLNLEEIPLDWNIFQCQFEVHNQNRILNFTKYN
jgi:tRNA threonylcarbamoyladenosine biosynthesis protein TsaE